MYSYLLDTCSDGIKNQDEEDIDCGGAACPPCALKTSKYYNHFCTWTWPLILWVYIKFQDIYDNVSNDFSGSDGITGERGRTKKRNAGNTEL